MWLIPARPYGKTVWSILFNYAIFLVFIKNLNVFELAETFVHIIYSDQWSHLSYLVTLVCFRINK